MYRDNNYTKTYKSFKDFKGTILLWLGGIVLAFFLVWICKHIFKEAMSKPAVLESFFNKPDQLEKVKGESKGETLCRDIARRVFGKEFIKIRPNFLKNAVTGANLELDIYNEELKLGIEFNGEQHYKYIPFFHKNYEAFLNQRYRDEIKKMLCKQNGIHLIEIRFDVTPQNIETIIRLEAAKLGFVNQNTSPTKPTVE